jgi:uncharacterized membrane protein
MSVETSPLDEQGSSSSGTGPGRTKIPWWPSLIGTTLSVLGLGVAAYLTYEHYTGSKSLSCPAGGGLINCLNVTTSIYAKIHGVPVAVLGLIFFAVMLVLQSPPAWSSPSRLLRAGRVVWSLVGVGTAVWLVYAELVKIRNICLWCTSVHIISLLIFLSTAFGTLATMPDIDEDEFGDEEFAG